MKVRKKHSWPRRLFRWFRIAFLACLLLGAGLLLWFNYVGLPQFIQEPLLAELRKHHFDLQLGKIRLQGFRHFVAENINFTANENAPTKFHIENAELLLDGAALRRLNFELEALDIRQGTLETSLMEGTNSVADSSLPRTFRVENISTRLELGRNDSWKIQNFHGDTLGVQMNVSGTISNISAATRSGAKPSNFGTNNAPVIREVLRQVAAHLNQFEFSSPPRLVLQFDGDVKEPQNSTALFKLGSPSAKSPWGSAESLEFSAELKPQGTNVIQFVLFGTAQVVSGIWGHATEARLEGNAQLPLQTNAQFQANWKFQAAELGNQQLKSGSLMLSADSTESVGSGQTQTRFSANLQKLNAGTATAERLNLQTSLLHPVPPTILALFGRQVTNQLDWLDLASTSSTNGNWKMELEGLNWEHSHLDHITVIGTVNRSSKTNLVENVSGFWKYLKPYQLTGNLTATNGNTADLKITNFSADAVWEYPLLSLLHLQANLGSGKLTGTAEMTLPEKRVSAALQTTFDPVDLTPLFSTDVQAFLRDISWTRKPVLDARFGFTLESGNNAEAGPAFTNVFVAGKLDGGLSVNGVKLNRLSSSFSLTNESLSLPEWLLETDYGTATGAFQTDLRSQTFQTRVVSGINPLIAVELVPKDARIAFAVLKFPEGHLLEAAVEGSLTNLPQVSVQASLAATNFMVREERFSELQTLIRYTNQVVSAHNLKVQRGREDLKIEMLYFNPSRMAIYVTNGVSTMNPWLAMSLVEEEVYEAIDPYRFDTPPFVKFNGWVPLANPQQADIVFDVKGTNFHYWRLNADTASAIVCWRTNLLSVTNVHAKFYGGTLDWEGHFKFNRDDSADYRFVGTTKNADLKPLMGDLVKHITGMEGTLNGTLVVTHANTEDWKSWQGYGEASLKNGLLWSIPVFGVFSPALDAIKSGLGTSKISEGSGSFRITNSVISTKDMEMRAPAFRLRYDGWVDFDGNVDATMQAQLFRDATLIGKPLSIVLWPVSKVLEGRITGKLDNPKRTLRHFNFLIEPIRNILSVKDMLPQPGAEGSQSESGPKK